ncbi:hypothetical protein A3Q56_07552 [Intoshia linei]|uniref:Uncharacterized protein n=1 Tax=Intoshia linei TaxID=1819745 RepID=A0A177ART8_9BILA|nr:hypothetical protein A3Q56_07552 [Intoshia linei]
MTKTSDSNIIICCADKDVGLAKKLKEELKSLNSTIISNRVRKDNSINLGLTICDCKIFLPIVSRDFLQSSNNKEELTLAFYADRNILPIGRLYFDDLFANYKIGTKLILERCDWSYIFEEISNTKQREMISNFRKKVENILNFNLNEQSTISTADTTPNLVKSRDLNSHKDRQIKSESRVKRKISNTETQVSNDMFGQEYWAKNFNSEESISLDTLYDSFLKNFEKELSQLIDKEGEYWIKQILGEVVDIRDDNVSYISFIEFCIFDGFENRVWETLSRHIAEAIAVKQVFDVESQFRVNVVEQLGKYHSNLVIKSLLSLLKDENPNVISVSIISLSRTGVNNKIICTSLLDLTKHPDRLVRQSACLALGKLKYSPAIQRLIHIWRNDFISVVRNSAHAALKSIGGPDAEQAVKVTRILEDELKELSMQ